MGLLSFLIPLTSYLPSIIRSYEVELVSAIIALGITLYLRWIYEDYLQEDR